VNLVGIGGAAKAATGGAAGTATPAAPGRLGTNGLFAPVNLQLKTQLAISTYINLIPWLFHTTGKKITRNAKKDTNRYAAWRAFT
jgi:hypothetical protein